MAILGCFCLMLGFFSCIFFSGFLLYSVWTRKEVDWMEYVQYFVFFCVSLALIILFCAFFKRDFSIVYVSEYTDTYLPWYYALSALWAGQEGSLLLWLFFVGMVGVLITRNKTYGWLSWDTRAIFWTLFLMLQGFFFLLLVTVANPFIVNPMPPKQGMGLNPLLMHPGMVFHPPALFLGYAGFCVPTLLFLSCRITGIYPPILKVIRRWSLVSWAFLSIGIVLGMWWSYFELGWGGYWAWDPVENSSLLPWLCATGFLHTLIVASREKGLERTSSFFLGLTLIFCFVATFLTRSGIIDSLHAFGQSTIGGPILFFIIISLCIVLYITIFSPATYSKQLSGLFSKNGILLISSFIFIGLCVVVLTGTMYPIISQVIIGQSKGVGTSFYNKVFLPISSFLIFLLFVCPWIKWRDEYLKVQGVLSLILFFLICFLLWIVRVRYILVLLSVAAGITGVISILYLILNTKLYKNKREFAKWGIHIGICIMAISIAISSGYKKRADFIVAKGQEIKFQGYKFKYIESYKQRYKNKIVHKYKFDVLKDGKHIGYLVPKRIFFMIQDNIFSKVSVITRWFDEIYISVLQSTDNGVLKIEIQKNPMVHWIWIGSIILALCGLIASSYGVKG